MKGLGFAFNRALFLNPYSEDLQRVGLHLIHTIQKEAFESKELSRETIPARHGGAQFVSRWFPDYAAVDPLRYLEEQK